MFDTSNPGPATPSDNSRIPQLRRELRSWTRDLVIIIFLYQPVKVEGTSMAPLLSDQERIFINKFVYRFEPIERGDVVVFWYPLDRTKSFIKRVVGLPGEVVEIRQALARRQLFCKGRPPHQLQRLARVRPGAQPLHLWSRRVRVLARGPLRFAFLHLHHGSKNKMSVQYLPMSSGGPTDGSSAPTRHSRAGRRAHI